MRRAATLILLTAQTVWERFELPILLLLVAVWMLICVHIGAGRAR